MPNMKATSPEALILAFLDSAQCYRKKSTAHVRTAYIITRNQSIAVWPSNLVNVGVSFRASNLNWGLEVGLGPKLTERKVCIFKIQRLKEATDEVLIYMHMCIYICIHEECILI